MSFQDITIVRQFNVINGYVTADRYGRGPLAGILAIPGVVLKELTVHDQKWVETSGGTLECCVEPPATHISRDVVDTVVETTPGTPYWPPTGNPENPGQQCTCQYSKAESNITSLVVGFQDYQGYPPYIAPEQCGCRNSFATISFVLIPDTGRDCYWFGSAQNGDFTATVYFDTELCLWIVTLSCTTEYGQQTIWQGSSSTRDGVYDTYIPGSIYWCAGKIGRRRVGKECRSRWSPYH
jgi:hypothetical protein